MQSSILKIEHLSYLSENKTLLNDISFSLNKGDTLAVLGHNGS